MAAALPCHSSLLLLREVEIHFLHGGLDIVALQKIHPRLPKGGNNGSGFDMGHNHPVFVGFQVCQQML
jgi:hypothetical protein